MHLRQFCKPFAKRLMPAEHDVELNQIIVQMTGDLHINCTCFPVGAENGKEPAFANTRAPIRSIRNPGP